MDHLQKRPNSRNRLTKSWQLKKSGYIPIRKPPTPGNTSEIQSLREKVQSGALQKRRNSMGNYVKEMNAQASKGRLSTSQTAFIPRTVCRDDRARHEYETEVS